MGGRTHEAGGGDCTRDARRPSVRFLLAGGRLLLAADARLEAGGDDALRC